MWSATCGIDTCQFAAGVLYGPSSSRVGKPGRGLHTCSLIKTHLVTGKGTLLGEVHYRKAELKAAQILLSQVAHRPRRLTASAASPADRASSPTQSQAATP